MVTNSEDEVDLRRCPLCGGKAEIHLADEDSDNRWVVECTECGAEQQSGQPFDLACELWNGTLPEPGR